MVEAVGLVPLQHRFFMCEKRSKTIRHIKETFDKVRLLLMQLAGAGKKTQPRARLWLLLLLST